MVAPAWDGSAPVPADVAATPGSLLQLIRQGRATTRSELVSMTGLGRSTVSQRVDALIAQELVREAGEAASTGGRPPVVLALNTRARVVLAGDLGATHSRLAVTDLAGAVLAEQALDLDIALGPGPVLDAVAERFRALLEECGRHVSEVAGIGVGVPGPVEHATSRLVSPPIMPGWDGANVAALVQERFGPVPVLVDNDVNVMAIGEYWAHWREAVQDLLFVKVATGIGAGVIAGGRIHRGAQGAAGDIGHVRVTGSDEPCSCGNTGCLEAVASGAALARALSTDARRLRSARDVVDAVRVGDRAAATAVRTAGRRLGEVLAAAVNLLNPAVIVIGGDLADASEHLLAGIREVLYERCPPLATQHLRAERGRLDHRDGITGAATMVIEHVLDPRTVDAAIARGRARAAS